MALPSVDEFKPEAMRLAASLVPTSRCCFYDVGSDLEPSGHVVLGDDTRYIASYVNRFRACDPFHPRYFASSPQSVFRTDQGGGTPVQRMDYIDGFMRPLGVAYKAEVFLRDERGIIIAGVRLSRRAALGEFRDQELSALRAMQPVAELALRAARARDRVSRLDAALTPRERELLRCVLDGLSNKLIARELGLALPTVKSHVKNILRKIGATSRADAISRIYKGGL